MPPSPSAKEWIKAGGALGAAILLARLTRTPLATLITTIPFLLQAFRSAEISQKKSTGSSMTREEAALILGVGAQASHDEIQSAHRRLIQKNHPDTGGSDYLAAQINQARDILLN
ncbi:MAG: hypothetical protein EBR02_02030 [Alphaproteobacteria bacterium]|nr:hypothetical protein [Alphaproteobacteria bacterium]